MSTSDKDAGARPDAGPGTAAGAAAGAGTGAATEAGAQAGVGAQTGVGAAARAFKEAAFADLPVTLRFELAQWNASLAEISQLAPGTVIELAQRIDEQSVSVWVEQHCIGKGQLVAIGERLGVRLVSVFAGEPAHEEERVTPGNGTRQPM